MSEPKDHHFVPEFYLRRWAEPGVGGKLVEYKLVHGGKVVHRQVTEDATGWEEHLYTQPALPPDLVQILEKRFFDLLDRRAARALEALSKKPHGPLAPDQRRDWSQFIMAYHLRHPDAFAEIKAAATAAWDNEDGSQERYEKLRKPTDPELYSDYLANRDPYTRAKAITRLMMATIDNKRLGGVLGKMEWHVLDLSNAGRTLLTSDRALQIGPLENGEGFVSIPISPTLLFIAVQKPELMRRLNAAPSRDVVVEVNKWVASRARRYVWAMDRKAEVFIERYIGKELEPVPLFPRLAKGRPAS